MPPGPGPARARLHRWAAWSAIATAVLFVAANVLWAFGQPEPGASSAELLRFYGDRSERIHAGGLLSLFSLGVFAVFLSAYRPVLVQLDGDELFANLAFGGGLLGLAAGVGAEGVNMMAAARAGDGELTGPLALALFDISYFFGSNGAGLGLGLFVAATGAVALRARALLPGWLAALAVVAGVAMLTPLWHDLLSQYSSAPAFLLLPVLAVVLLRGGGARAPAAAPAQP